jgi:predicted nucleotidyltransferase
MITQQHFEELLQLLEKNKAEYVIIGGYAVAFHGYPRFTKDIDIFFRNSPENIRKVIAALVKFGFPESDLPYSLFSETGNIIQFGVSPLRVDIINEIDGVSFDEAFNDSVRGKYGSVEVNFIGRAQLIKNKKKSGRPQDIVDAEKLEKKVK